MSASEEVPMTEKPKRVKTGEEDATVPAESSNTAGRMIDECFFCDGVVLPAEGIAAGHGYCSKCRFAYCMTEDGPKIDNLEQSLHDRSGLHTPLTRAVTTALYEFYRGKSLPAPKLRRLVALLLDMNVAQAEHIYWLTKRAPAPRPVRHLPLPPVRPMRPAPQRPQRRCSRCGVVLSTGGIEHRCPRRPF